MLTENQKVGGMIHSHFDRGNFNLSDHVVLGGGGGEWTRNVTKGTNSHVVRVIHVHLQ
jgi:hypothetical protein